MLELFDQYLREREGKQVLKSEQGFATYGFNCVPGVDFPHVYICDIYTRPEYRKTSVARDMADTISEQAKAKGVKIMLGSVDTNAKGAHESLLVLIAYGMKLFTTSDSTIFFSKEI
jgi:ribosomal protein S18 acetylase RimI-like enzyme